MWDSRFLRLLWGDAPVRTHKSELSHRGPDGHGLWLGDSQDVGLGHTRLAVIDLKTDAQPMHSIDNHHLIVFNREIYHYKGLTEEWKNA